LEEWGETIRHCEVVWKSRWRDSWIPYAYLANAYCAEGKYDKAEECLNDFLENVHDLEAVRGTLASVYLCQGEYERALLEIEKASQPSAIVDFAE
jgi:pentatricopeptide repeat protein